MNRTLDALLVAAAALIAFVLAGPVLTIPLHIPLGYNEGWNAYFQQRAVRSAAGPLYPAADALVFNNYPPLSFYLVGALGRYVTGDMIVAGRITALTALLASAALLATCVRRLGGSGRGGLAAAALLLLFAGTFFRSYVAIDDPQWLAHALMLAGLATLLGRPTTLPGCPATRPGGAATRPGGAANLPGPATARVIAAALLVTAGGFVKHNLIGLPLAVTAWLLLTRPRAAAAWLATAASAIAAGGAATAVLHGHAAFADLLGHHRVFRASRAPKAVSLLLPLLPMLAIAVTTRPTLLLPTLFLAVSLATGIVQRLGDGVNYNAYFETLIALCLATGLALSRALASARQLRPRLTPAGLALSAALPLLLTMPQLLRHAWTDLAARPARQAAWQPVIAALATTRGRVACETLSLCYWAGKPFELDEFNLNQSLLSGGPTARLAALLRSHTLRLVEYDGTALPGPHFARNLAADPLLTALIAHGYAPTATGPDRTVLLSPPTP